MTNRDIYNAASRLSGEMTSDNPDYSARTMSLLAIVFDECAPLDSAYRIANELAPRSWPVSASISLDATFPLCDIFWAPAAYGLAALLTTSENPDLSRSFEQHFFALMKQIQNDLPAKPEPIVDAYHLL